MNVSGLTLGQSTPDDPSLALLKLMADPGALAGRIAEYEAAKKTADAAVALVGKAKEIENLRAQAQIDRETATGILSRAQTDAAAKLSKAESDAAKMISDANAQVAEAKAFADRANAEGEAASAAADKAKQEAAALIKSAKAEAAAMQLEAAKALKDASSAKSEAAALMQDAMSIKSKFEAKLKKLQAASADD